MCETCENWQISHYGSQQCYEDTSGRRLLALWCCHGTVKIPDARLSLPVCWEEMWYTMTSAGLPDICANSRSYIPQGDNAQSQKHAAFLRIWKDILDLYMGVCSLSSCVLPSSFSVSGLQQGVVTSRGLIASHSLNVRCLRWDMSCMTLPLNSPVLANKSFWDAEHHIAPELLWEALFRGSSGWADRSSSVHAGHVPFLASLEKVVVVHCWSHPSKTNPWIFI